MNQLMNHGGVCRTAPATPGLLNTCLTIPLTMPDNPKTNLMLVWHVSWDPKILPDKCQACFSGLVRHVIWDPWACSLGSPNYFEGAKSGHN